MARKYGDGAIRTMSGLEHIYHRPSMYGFDPHSQAGVFLMCKEILDNSLDEAGLDPNAKHEINIMFAKKRNTFQCVVTDTGRGIPLRKLKSVFTDANTSGKWDDSYGFSIGSNGIGCKGTVVQSSHLIAACRRKEGVAILHTKGLKIARSEVVKGGGSAKTGTTVFFEPNPARMPVAKNFFEEAGGYLGFYDLVEFSSVNLKNTTFKIWFRNKPLDVDKLSTMHPNDFMDAVFPTHKECGEELFVSNPDLDLVGYTLGHHDYNKDILLWNSGMTEARNIKVPITIQTGIKDKRHSEMSFRVQLFLDRNSYGTARRPKSLSIINMIRMTSKNVSQYYSMVKVAKRMLEPFVDKKYSEFFMKNYQLPLNTIVIAEWQHAVYVGQDKTEFRDKDFEHGFETALMREFAKLGEDSWKELHALIESDIKKMFSRKTKRDLGLAGGDSNLSFQLNNPRCYYECKQTGPGTELLICEGVSSGDYVKQHRNPETQAVFELKGKILNAFKKGDGDLHELCKNPVISDLLLVLGTSPEDVGLESMRFERIGILSDADADGGHITTLVLSDLFHINPALFTQRRIFKLNPPLYIVNVKGDPKPSFIRNAADLREFQASLYGERYSLATQIGTKVYNPNEELQKTLCVAIRELGKTLVEVAKKQHVEPGMLELLSHCVPELKKQNAKGLVNKLGCDKARFDKPNGILYLEIDGFETIIPTTGLVAEIEKNIIKDMKRFNMDKVQLIVTDKETGEACDTTITALCKIFERLDNSYRIRRMKGIGEMDKKHLISTCLNPKTRNATVIEGVGNISRIRDLMGSKSEPRKELVMDKVGSQ